MSESKKWRSRGADPAIESFYTTTYASSYTRPQTMQSRSTHFAPPVDTSGFSSNNRISPFDLEPLEDRSIYQTTTSHATFSPQSSVLSLKNPKPMVRAVMEHSGYWTEPEPSVLNDSPARRAQNAKTREINASFIPPQTLKNLRQHNPVEAENNGAGPTWGSTTSGMAYCKHESSHDRYWKMNRDLIGKKENDAFSRQHITIPEDPIDEQKSITHSTYVPPPRNRNISIPSRTVIERTGYTDSIIPTLTHPVEMSQYTADELHPIEVARLKHKDTTEYQNLFNHDAYKSIAQISYQWPGRNNGERASTAITNVRRGGTGYNSNTTMTAGAPGDPNTFKTGKTETMKKFKDPSYVTAKTRGDTMQVPNIVERSGYWAT